MKKRFEFRFREIWSWQHGTAWDFLFDSIYLPSRLLGPSIFPSVRACWTHERFAIGATVKSKGHLFPDIQCQWYCLCSIVHAWLTRYSPLFTHEEKRNQRKKYDYYILLSLWLRCGETKTFIVCILILLSFGWANTRITSHYPWVHTHTQCTYHQQEREREKKGRAKPRQNIWTQYVLRNDDLWALVALNDRHRHFIFQGKIEN